MRYNLYRINLNYLEFGRQRQNHSESRHLRPRTDPGAAMRSDEKQGY